MARPPWPRPKTCLKTLYKAVFISLLLATSVQCNHSDSSSKCLTENWSCALKVNLLEKVTELLEISKEKKFPVSVGLMSGLVVLETNGEVAGEVDNEVDTWDSDAKLNELLVEKLTRFFKDKTLTVKLIPGLIFKLLPAKTANDFVRLTVRLSGENFQQVMSRTMKMGGMMRSPWMLIGPMITLGMFPFMLANLKYMVMNAFMINNMALMMALRTTITNMVFGDGEGDNIVYRNKGYSNEFKNKPIDYPIRYTVKPYNQINKYRKTYETHPLDEHVPPSSLPNAHPSKNTSRDGPVRYIAHHDYFGARRPAISLVRTPIRTQIKQHNLIPHPSEGHVHFQPSPINFQESKPSYSFTESNSFTPVTKRYDNFDNHRVSNIPSNHKHVSMLSRMDTTTKEPSGVKDKSVVESEQSSWVAKDDSWPVIYQDPTTWSQESKNQIGTLQSGVSKTSVQLSSGIRFDSDPALGSLDLTDENEFVNLPQRLVQARLERPVEPETGVFHRRVGGASENEEQSSFPEPLWVFKEEFPKDGR